MENKRMLSEKEGMRYCGLGRNRFRDFAFSNGAVVHIGRRILFDKQKLDNALDRLLDEQNPIDGQAQQESKA